MKLKLLVLFFVTIFSFSSEFIINASQVENQTSIDVSSTIITPDESGVISINLNNGMNIAGLSFSIYYDSSVFDINSHGTYGIFDSGNVSVNDETEGEVHVSFASSEGVDFSGKILTLYFSVDSQAPSNTYQIDLAVDEVYDENLSLITVKKSDGSITVTENIEPVEHINFYNQVSMNSLSIGQKTTYRFYAYQLKNLSAGNFQIHYDASLLKLIDISPSNDLERSGVLLSINTDIEGYIDISFASLDALNDYDIFFIEFEVIANVDASSEIQMIPKNLYDDDLNPMVATSVSREISIIKNKVVEDYPDIYITDYQGDMNESFEVQVKVQSNSNLAAGDFTIHYDNDQLTVINVLEGEMISEHGGYLFFNPNYEDGFISFSYINENGLIEENTFLTIEFKAKASTDSTYFDINISGSGLVNKDFESIELDYISPSIYLGEYKTIRYLDFNDSIYYEEHIPFSDQAIKPKAPKRDGAVFSHWEHVKTQGGLMVYKAVYSLEDDYLIFDDGSFTYNGSIHQLSVDNRYEGISLKYNNNDQVNAGDYLVEAEIYLDGLYQTTLSANLLISPKLIEITLDDNSIIYGQDINTTYDISGLVGEDSLDLIFSIESDPSVGDHLLMADIDNSNYEATVLTSTLTISKAPITITADDQRSSYGEQINKLTYSIDGNIYYDDEINVILEKEVGLDVGLYDILINASHPNYDINLIDGTYIIEKANFDMSSISFADQEIVFDGLNHDILVDGDLPEGVSVNYINNGQIDVGTYIVEAKFSHDNNNYNQIDDFQATLTIVPAKIKDVFLDDLSVIYNGENHTLIPSGLSDDMTYSYLGGSEFLDVGVYTIKVRVSEYGHDDLELTGTLTIHPIQVTLIADNQISSYGEELKELSYSIEGQILQGDNLNIVLEKEGGLSAGQYPISISGSHPNYDIALVDGIYTIEGVNVDLSTLEFADTSYVYDGEEKSIVVVGDLPEGVIEVKYVNNVITDVGQTQAVARLILQEEYNPVENMVATLTITKADIDNVDLLGGEYTYDGQEKSFELSTRTTQYGDEFEIVTDDSLTYIDAGEYSITMTLKHPNYNDLVLSSSLTIHRADLSIEENDFNITARETSIILEHEFLQDYIKLSKDGSAFIQSHIINDLEENSLYTITIYIDESNNYLTSNVIDIQIKTLLSWESYYQGIDNIKPGLDTRQSIINLIEDRTLLNSANQELADVEIQKLIDEYNQLVEQINQEYQVVEEINMRLNAYCFMIPIILLGFTILERRLET